MIKSIYRCVIRDAFGGDSSWGYYGVYDGHGGRQVVDYTVQNLHEVFLQELRNCMFSKDQMRGILAIIACAAKNGPTSSRLNVSATVRYLRRAVAIERRWEGDLTGHHFWAIGQRGRCTIIHCVTPSKKHHHCAFIDDCGCRHISCDFHSLAQMV